MRRKDIRVNGQGGYITVYQRPSDTKEPLLDLNLFDGDRSIEEAIELRNALTEAIETARRMAK